MTDAVDKAKAWDALAKKNEEISKLKRRVTVLEMVIAEELNPNDCIDDANAMIAEEIHKRSDTIVGGASND